MSKDTDGDGRLDFREYVDGTDPFCYNKSWNEHAGDFVSGFFAGDFIEESNSVAVMAGQITGSFIPFVDARDVLANLIHGDYAFAGLSAIGLVPAGGDVTKAAGKVGKFMVKNVDDIPKVANLLEFLNKNCPDLVKVLGKNEDFLEAARQLSKADNIKLTRKQMYVVTEDFENAGLSHYLVKTSNSIPDLKAKVNISSSIWEEGVLSRGKQIDDLINLHSQGIGLGKNFPVVDRLIKDEKLLVSTKSLDIAAPSYQNMNKLDSRLNRYADSLLGFEERYFKGENVFEWNGRLLNRDDYEKKVLEIVLPDIVMTENALEVLKNFKNSIAKKGIEVWYRTTN
ncbi:MAG: hypothetical protein IKL04_07305 [Lachnospiraceae bacterium]|nr:hypothetical protein [Lachnospiraceae bacterium]